MLAPLQKQLELRSSGAPPEARALTAVAAARLASRWPQPNALVVLRALLALAEVLPRCCTMPGPEAREACAAGVAEAIGESGEQARAWVGECADMAAAALDWDSSGAHAHTAELEELDVKELEDLVEDLLEGKEL